MWPLTTASLDSGELATQQDHDRIMLPRIVDRESYFPWKANYGIVVGDILAVQVIFGGDESFDR